MSDRYRTAGMRSDPKPLALSEFQALANDPLTGYDGNLYKLLSDLRVRMDRRSLGWRKQRVCYRDYITLARLLDPEGKRRR